MEVFEFLENTQESAIHIKDQVVNTLNRSNFNDLIDQKRVGNFKTKTLEYLLEMNKNLNKKESEGSKQNLEKKLVDYIIEFLMKERNADPKPLQKYKILTMSERVDALEMQMEKISKN